MAWRARKNSKQSILRHLEELLDEEISEAGVHFARAWVAKEKGLAETPSVLRDVAYDEARHAV